MRRGRGEIREGKGVGECLRFLVGMEYKDGFRWVEKHGKQSILVAVKFTMVLWFWPT